VTDKNNDGVIVVEGYGGWWSDKVVMDVMKVRW